MKAFLIVGEDRKLCTTDFLNNHEVRIFITIVSLVTEGRPYNVVEKILKYTLLNPGTEYEN